MTTYKIKRFFYSDEHPSEVIATGLTLEEAQEHCNDKETSSRSATGETERALTAERGMWFDGYEEE